MDRARDSETTWRAGKSGSVRGQVGDRPGVPGPDLHQGVRHHVNSDDAVMIFDYQFQVDAQRPKLRSDLAELAAQ
jgi:hypothetical protein